MELGWLKKEFHLNLRIRPGGLLLALAYAVTFWAVRQISVDQWVLSAGLRVGALLLLPPRYWPYLFLGEYAFFTYSRYPLIDKFGLAWAVVSSAAAIPAAAYIVHRHRALIASGNPFWLISVAGLCAFTITVLSLGSAYLLMPQRHEAVSWDGLITYVTGDFLGILIFAPLVALWKYRKQPIQFARGWRMDVLASLAIFVLLGAGVLHFPDTDAAARNSLRILMILPAIALTCLHGWRGAAVGVAMLNLIVGFTMESSGLPGSRDSNALVAQEILAIAGTALLLLGSTISHFYRKFSDGDQLGRRALAAARTHHLAGEREMRDRAIRMEIIGDDIDSTLRQAAQTLRERGHHAAASDLLRASMTQTQLFREQLLLVYPSGIERYGLYITLESGVIDGAWEPSGRLARPILSGDPCRLGLSLQLAAYRSIYEAVCLLLEHETGTILVRARCGRRGAHRGIVINVALIDTTRTLSPDTVSRALDTLMGRALVYGGTVRCRRNRIRLLLGEAATTPAVQRVPSGASIDQMMPPAIS